MKRKSLLVLAIVLMSIGFAAVSTTLFINGNTNVASNTGDFDVYFSKAYENNKENISLIQDKTHIVFTTTLSNVDDEYTLIYEITNGSKNYDANFDIRYTGEYSKYINFHNEIDTKKPLKARETRRGKIMIVLEEGVLEETSVKISFEITGKALEKDTLGEEIIKAEEGNYLASAIPMWDRKLNQSDFEKKLTIGIYGSMEEYESQMNAACPNGYNDTSEACQNFKIEDSQKMYEYIIVLAYGSKEEYLKQMEIMCPNGEDDTSPSCEYFKDEAQEKIAKQLYGEEAFSPYLWEPVIQVGLNSWQESKKSDIESIHFLTTTNVPDNAILSWDASNKQNGSVMAYTLDEDNDGLYEVYIGQDGGVVANPDSTGLFKEFDKVTEITGLETLDTSHVTNMKEMFYNCGSLTSLDVTHFDTSNVTNMYRMFYNCNDLMSLDVSSFNTNNLQESEGMFCMPLEPDISMWTCPDEIKTKVKNGCPI